MSEELISKKNLIKELKEWLSEFEGIPETLYGQGYDDAIKAAIAIVENEMPTNEKTGRWIFDTTNFLPEYVCSNCRTRFSVVASDREMYGTLNCKNMNYCPNCGAKMEGEVK